MFRKRKSPKQAHAETRANVKNWLEPQVYALFEQCMQQSRYPTTQEAALLQLYQASLIGDLADSIENMVTPIDALYQDLLERKSQFPVVREQ